MRTWIISATSDRAIPATVTAAVARYTAGAKFVVAAPTQEDAEASVAALLQETAGQREVAVRSVRELKNGEVVEL